jgi:hypothetical protein
VIIGFTNNQACFFENKFSEKRHPNKFGLTQLRFVILENIPKIK